MRTVVWLDETTTAAPGATATDSSRANLTPPVTAPMRQFDEATERALRQIQRAISSDNPSAASDHIGDVLRSHFERTRDARVQNFRLVLAERETRALIRREQ